MIVFGVTIKGWKLSLRFQLNRRIHALINTFYRRNWPIEYDYDDVSMEN